MPSPRIAFLACVATLSTALSACATDGPAGNGDADGSAVGGQSAARGNSGGSGAGGAGGITIAGTVGCNIGSGGISPPPDGPQVSCSPADVPPTDPAALRLFKSIQRNLDADLLRAIGQYVCGDSPLYSGTFTAGNVPPSGVSLQTGPVIASLETTTNPSGGLACYQDDSAAVKALVVTSAEQNRGVRFFQLLNTNDGATHTSSVALAAGSGDEDRGSCAGCLLDLRGEAPATIDLPTTDFQSPACGPPQQTSVMAYGHLDKIASPSVDDIAAVASRLEIAGAALTFTIEDGDLVARIDGDLWHEDASTPVNCNSRLHSKYHLEWYVDVRDIEIYGLRNFVIDQQDVYCCEGEQI